ncbi:PREDICTED: nucleolar complex protein 4 homolog B-like [Priapulus caudatus]|uniref:Nucleolar complex protein 4 homolog B-like n=1 Tax=Priapulus caudatus TaxID=37621 RepID=A0ABM1EPZ3_PRICU|nr:PREDICTED: nucleolar complex protein 4 homolog B-like [Priapulus caudatus]
MAPSMKRQDRDPNLMKEREIIKGKAKAFLEDRKNANELVEILSYFADERAEILLSAIRAVHKLFCHVINSKSMVLQKSTLELGDNEGSTAEKYRVWLQGLYADTIDQLLSQLNSRHENVAELAVTTLLKFLEREGTNPLVQVEDVKYPTFPTKLFAAIMDHALSSEADSGRLILRLTESLEFADMRLHCLRQVSDSILKKRDQVVIFYVCGTLGAWEGNP